MCAVNIGLCSRVLKGNGAQIAVTMYHSTHLFTEINCGPLYDVYVLFSIAPYLWEILPSYDTNFRHYFSAWRLYISFSVLNLHPLNEWLLRVYYNMVCLIANLKIEQLFINLIWEHFHRHGMVIWMQGCTGPLQYSIGRFIVRSCKVSKNRDWRIPVALECCCHLGSTNA